MREVVPIRTDLEVELLEEGSRDDAAVDRLAEPLKLLGPLRRLREALDG